MAIPSTATTPAEEAVMKRFHDIVIGLRDSHRTAHSGADSPIMLTLSNPSARPASTLYEITLEVVARDAKNFVNTNAFKNRMFSWGRQLRMSNSDVDGINATALMQSWVRCIVVYYQTALGDSLATLGADFQQSSEEAFSAQRQDSSFDSQLERTLERARCSVQDSVCLSRKFSEALQLMPRFMRSFKIATALSRSFASHTSGPEYNNVLRDCFQADQWLFYMLALLMGVLRLRDLATDNNRDGGDAAAAAAAMTMVGRSDLSTAKLQTYLSTITELLNISVEDSNTLSDHLVTTKIKYVCAVCSNRFPPRELDRAIAELGSWQQKHIAERQTLPTMTYAELTTQPLFLSVVKEMPSVVDAREKFISDVTIDPSWVRAAMNTTLYRFTTTTRSSSSSGVAAASNPFSIPAEAHNEGSFLYEYLICSLRQMVRQLLACAPPAAEDKSGDQGGTAVDAPPTPGGVGGGDGNGSGDAIVLTESQRAAWAALSELADAVSKITMPRTTTMRKWSALDLGHSYQVTCNFGDDCMKKALSAVLEEALRDVLVWTTQPEKQWERVLNAPGDTGAITDDGAKQFLRHLLRAEKIYNAVTDAAATTTTTTTTTTTALTITALQRYKELFSEAASAALDRVYRLNGSLALIVPVVTAVHSYLNAQTEREGGPDRAAAPRGAPQRRPPMPRPSKAPPAAGGDAHDATTQTLSLSSRSDLHSALRLVLCVKERDLFLGKYVEALKLRLLFRSPPKLRTDAKFDEAKRANEQAACDYLVSVMGPSATLTRVRKMIEDATQSTTSTGSGSSALNYGEGSGSGVKLAVTVQDWRHWGSDEKNYLLARGAAPHLVAEGQQQQQHTTTTTTTTTTEPMPSEPFPFPSDLWAALTEYQSQYEGTHHRQTLRWLAASTAYTSFTIAFPKADAPVTVHCTVDLQQLLLAIAQYRRAGVSYATLASRSGGRLTADQVERKLRPLLARDHLLVAVAKEGAEAVIALNYDFVPPTQGGRTRDFVYWIPCQSTLEAIDAETQVRIARERELVTNSVIIKIMKSKREIAHNDLFSEAEAKLKDSFALTMRIFKTSVEGLIEKEFVERVESAPGKPLYRYKA